MNGSTSGMPSRSRPPGEVERILSATPRRLIAPSRARKTPTAGQLARRRFLLRWTKRLLPVLAVGLLLAVALWPEFERSEDRARVSFRRVIQASPEALRVVEPRYQGLDEQNRPYTLTADTATQAGQQQDVVDLEEPRADILLNDGAWVLLEARAGRFDKARNHLDLTGNVTLWHDNGTMMVTEQAAVQLAEGAASGDAPVAAQGPFGTLTSEGFRLRDRGQVVIFTGNARAVLEGRQ